MTLIQFIFFIKIIDIYYNIYSIIIICIRNYRIYILLFNHSSNWVSNATPRFTQCVDDYSDEIGTSTLMI